jgi:ribosomal protein L4
MEDKKYKLERTKDYINSLIKKHYKCDNIQLSNNDLNNICLSIQNNMNDLIKSKNLSIDYKII